MIKGQGPNASAYNGAALVTWWNRNYDTRPFLASGERERNEALDPEVDALAAATWRARRRRAKFSTTAWPRKNT